ncbi:MAG: AarF/ABC1/UbiB kinase family protein [Nitrosopumilus sp.]|nr:AarF/ABC1/UbiB kinase family protein [Nitrosopumilus sp.]CAI9831079.1 conserved hypothetical protein [Nitrosopumilaceae archaeon]MDA7941172.1 AarF/ABC1/UbiB kinase family protein [Nitrosopumilus sp.]MDA7942430.1 AarF/ABC1/UbiB kinase family protein [Nitrosopumilus sp.]MDA7944849.1 AarF/ABC1/UbiB kinase family protein [Nitrosopumilus sp.]
MHTIRTLLVFARLLPSVLALRRDRRIWTGRAKADPEKFRRNARRLLDALVSLGPVYIKLGQWLSSRADILPQPYLEVMARLQDQVPPAPFEEVRPSIERDLGPIESRFDEFDTESISGASLGQVYRGAVAGRQVVVKVRRPGIEEAVRRDVEVLKKVLPVALRFVDPNLRHSARAMLAQFTETIREELDYTAEAGNLARIREAVSGMGIVVVPDVLPGHSTRNVLTMEYLPGTKVTDVAELDRRGVDREKLVVDLHRVFFTMLLRHSIFHADPHPGNISITDSGRLILYDYGMVGRIDPETRKRLIRLYLALVEKDPPRVVNAMDDLGMLVPGYDRDTMEKAMDISVRAMHGNKPDEMEVQGLMELANRTMSRFPFVLPKNLALYMRMATIIEGIYKTHGVEFRFVRVLREILREEDLVTGAYVEELKIAARSAARSIDSLLRLGPEVRAALAARERRPRPPVLLAGSIFAAAVFAGSSFIYPASPQLGWTGMITAACIMAISAVLGRR